MVVSIALHGLFLLASAGALLHDLIVHGVPNPWLTFNIATLLLGYAGAVTASLIGLDRVGRPEFKPILFALPLYWMLACYTVMRAAIDLVARPTYWSKTIHRGLGANLEKHDMPPTIAKMEAPKACNRNNNLARQT